MTGKLQNLLSRIATDEAFRGRVLADKKALAEVGWSPRAISGFELKTVTKARKNCGTECGCTPKIGQGCSSRGGGTVGEEYANCGSECGCTASIGQGCGTKSGATCGSGQGVTTRGRKRRGVRQR